MVVLVATVGGLFAVMTFIHFFVDWICQTHSEAMQKHNNWKVRTKHCAIKAGNLVSSPSFLI